MLSFYLLLWYTYNHTHSKEIRMKVQVGVWIDHELVEKIQDWLHANRVGHGGKSAFIANAVEERLERLAKPKMEAEVDEAKA